MTKILEVRRGFFVAQIQCTWYSISRNKHLATKGERVNKYEIRKTVRDTLAYSLHIVLDNEKQERPELVAQLARTESVYADMEAQRKKSAETVKSWKRQIQNIHDLITREERVQISRHEESLDALLEKFREIEKVTQEIISTCGAHQWIRYAGDAAPIVEIWIVCKKCGHLRIIPNRSQPPTVICHECGVRPSRISSTSDDELLMLGTIIDTFHCDCGDLNVDRWTMKRV